MLSFLSPNLMNDASADPAASNIQNTEIIATPNCTTPGRCPTKDTRPTGIDMAVKSVKGAGSEAEFDGTSIFMTCQDIINANGSKASWASLVGSAGTQSTNNHWDGAWAQLVRNHDETINEIVESYSTSFKSIRTGHGVYELPATEAAQPEMKAQVRGVAREYKKAAQLFLDQAGRLFDDALECEGIRKVADQVDYSDAEAMTGETSGKSAKKTLDGKISCVKMGAETQDYPACATLVNAYNAATVAQVGVREIQKIDYMDTELDEQTNMMKDPNSPTGALKAQENMVKKQADIANQRAAFHTAKLGALLFAFEAMPTKAELYDTCISRKNKGIENLIKQYKEFVAHVTNTAKSHLGKTVSFSFRSDASSQNSHLHNPDLIQETTANNNQASNFPNVKVPLTVSDNFLSLIGTNSAEGGGEVDTQTRSKELNTWITAGNKDATTDLTKTMVAKSCKKGIYDGANLIMNGPARDAAKAAMIQAGVDIAGNALKGNLLDKQAKRIADAAKGIKDFKPEDLPMFQNEDALVSACEANPGGPECLELDNLRGVGFAGQSFNFEGANRATTDGVSRDENGDPIVSESGDDATDRGANINKIGRSTNGVKKGGGLSSVAGAASVKGGAANSAAGAGGGGGGPSSVSAPGGGGGGRGAGAGGGPRGRVSNVKFGGTGAGSLSFGGGSRRRAKSKKVANPFAKMFGKKKGGKGGVTSFRNPASIGSKKGSLFNMISSRYKDVNKKKRLMEYEVTAKN